MRWCLPVPLLSALTKRHGWLPLAGQVASGYQELWEISSLLHDYSSKQEFWSGSNKISLFSFLRSELLRSTERQSLLEPKEAQLTGHVWWTMAKEKEGLDKAHRLKKAAGATQHPDLPIRLQTNQCRCHILLTSGFIPTTSPRNLAFQNCNNQILSHSRSQAMKSL